MSNLDTCSEKYLLFYLSLCTGDSEHFARICLVSNVFVRILGRDQK